MTLDREETAQYTLTIQAYDGGYPHMTNTTSVIVNVRDVNDNSPVINQTSITKTLSEVSKKHICSYFDFSKHVSVFLAK